MDFNCDICGAGFYTKQYLAKHKTRVHNVKCEKILNFTCNYCEKRFVSKNTLTKHNVKIHNLKSVGTVSCQEENCVDKFPTVCKLREHLKNVHLINDIDNYEELKFQKYTDFDEWLSEEEKMSSAEYVVAKKSKLKDHIYYVFECNRSGTYNPKTENVNRQLKAQGTKKIGFHCTSRIHVKELHSGEVCITYFKQHYKHEKMLCHLSIPNAEKEIIAGKILQGVGEKRILTDIKQVDNEKIERAHLITRKDLQNIKRDFGLNLPSKGGIVNGDEQSVCAWVEEMKKKEQNPVLFYKRQDEEHHSLAKKDFLLVIMTNFQKSMLCRFGADRVCVDATHGISGYDFELVTLLVIDDHEEGIPVAFCIMSTVDTKTLMHFFDCIKSAISRCINPQVFMSDDAAMFKNAWSNVFGPCVKYLLCAWHVDRAWRKNISSLKKEIQADIYKTLKTIMYELDEIKFKCMLDNFCEMLKEDANTEKFYSYFMQYYYSRSEMWAYCFRKAAKINTNMHIENFHRCLKHIYLEGKRTKRLDKVIRELIQLVNDKNFDMYVKSVKGKITKRATQNFKRHREGKNLEAVLNKLQDIEWEIVSAGKVYNLTKVHTCNSSCLIACRMCAVCSKAYSCTCHDYAISNFMCKHIHFFIISSNKEKKFTGPLNELVAIDLDRETETQNDPNLLESTKIKFNAAFSKFNSITNIEDNVVIQIKHHLNAIEHLMNIKSETYLPSKRICVPYNKKIIPQKRFYSVKKQRASKSNKLAKPTTEENNKKKSILLKEPFCSNDRNFDHKYF